MLLRGYKSALRWKSLSRAQVVVGRPRSCLLITSPVSSTRPVCNSSISDEKSRPVSIFARHASSQSSPNNKNGDIIIYRRNPKDNRIPRGNVAFCFFHTAYWSWYAEQCAETFLLLDATTTTAGYFMHPTAGLYGLTFAMVLNFACYKYSTLIVSKMAFHAQSGKVRVWSHKLPFLTTTDKPLEFELGQVFLDRTKAEVIYLLEKLGGDMTDFRGHLPLKVQDSQFPLLVYCNDGYVVKDNDMFLEALLFDMSPNESEENEENEVEETKHDGKGQTLRRSTRRKASRRGMRRVRRPRG